MIIYLVKSTLLLGLLLGVYKLLLENEKMHRFNRFFLLFALVFGLTAPLISFEVSPEQSIAGIQMQQMERIVNAPAEAVSNSVEPLIVPQQEAFAQPGITPSSPEKPHWPISILDILLGIYVLVTLFLLIRFAGGLFEIRNKIKIGSHKETDHATLVLLDEPITPQSFLGYIFLDRKQFEAREIEPEILDHEITHIRQLHSLDVLFAEFLKVIFWFNPLMYLYKHAIQLNHEFLADESVISNGSSVSGYQKMLIRVCAGNNPMNTTSSIGYALTKKRLKLMGKHISRTRSNSIKVFLAPVVICLSLMFCTNQNADKGLTPIELRSSFIGGYYKSEPILYIKEEDKVTSPSYYPFDPVLYNEEGEIFTGTRTFYSRSPKNPGWEDHITDGILTKTVYLNKKMIESNRVAYTLYEYEDGRYVTKTSHDSNDELIQRFEYTENSTRNYSPDGRLISYGYTEIKDGNKWTYQKAWYPNGNLMMEIESGKDSSGLQSIWVHYDEEGNIESQTRIEDGELIREKN